jgi:hypothetical protein
LQETWGSPRNTDDPVTLKVAQDGKLSTQDVSGDGSHQQDVNDVPDGDWAKNIEELAGAISDDIV